MNNRSVPTAEAFAVSPKATNILMSPILAFAASVIAVSLWIGAIVALPEFQRSGLSLILGRLVVHLLLLGGAWAGLNRTSLKASERMWTWIAIAIPLTLWHAGAWAIVSFAVPSSLVLHALSLRQLRRRTRPDNSLIHIENT
jgi:hypothetical protein